MDRLVGKDLVRLYLAAYRYLQGRKRVGFKELAKALGVSQSTLRTYLVYDHLGLPVVIREDKNGHPEELEVVGDLPNLTFPNHRMDANDIDLLGALLEMLQANPALLSVSESMATHLDDSLQNHEGLAITHGWGGKKAVYNGRVVPLRWANELPRESPDRSLFARIEGYATDEPSKMPRHLSMVIEACKTETVLKMRYRKQGMEKEAVTSLPELSILPLFLFSWQGCLFFYALTPSYDYPAKYSLERIASLEATKTRHCFSPEEYREVQERCCLPHVGKKRFLSWMEGYSDWAFGRIEAAAITIKATTKKELDSFHFMDMLPGHFSYEHPCKGKWVLVAKNVYVYNLLSLIRLLGPEATVDHKTRLWMIEAQKEVAAEDLSDPFCMEYTDQFDAVIRLSPELAKTVLQRSWPQERTEVSKDGDSYLLTITTSGKEELLRYLRYLGSGAELLQPEACRKELQDSLKELCNTYGVPLAKRVRKSKQ